MVAADATTAVAFSLTPGQAGDAPEGNKLLTHIGRSLGKCSVIMDRAYEGDETRQLVKSFGYTPVVPPKVNRISKWRYNKKLYKKRNEVERLFRRLKGFRRVATRYDKTDIMFLGFVVFSLVVMGLKNGG
jgi:transposase